MLFGTGTITFCISNELFPRLQLFLVRWDPLLASLDPGDSMLAPALLRKSAYLLGGDSARLSRRHVISDRGNDAHFARGGVGADGATM